MSNFENFAVNIDSEMNDMQLTELNRKLFIQLQKVIQENAMLKSENVFLKEHIRIDPLTRVYNREFMEEYLNEELERAERYNAKFSMIIVDIDHFKRINDNYGHQKGDEILKKVAAIFNKAVRKSDIIFRYGGEEFLIALPETGLNGAYAVANKLRKMVESEIFDGIDSNVTVSVGLCERKNSMALEEMIYSVDMALYDAKRNGRNQVRIAA